MGVRDWLGRSTTPDTPVRAVLAAAMPMSGPGVAAVSKARAATIDSWQKEAWYFYDAIGELRAPVTWIANAVSAAHLYAAEVDPETGLITGPTDNTTVQAAANAVLGGQAKRAQLQQTLAVCWQVPGEAYVIVRPKSAVKGVAQPDEWLVLSGTQVQAKGGKWQYTDPQTLMPVQLGANDWLLRVWSPHPNDLGKADSAVRPALPILREVEKASMNVAARLDSRLAGNGLLALPQEMDFPHGDDQSVAESFAGMLLEAAEASIQNPGTAAAQVPITFTMPQEMIAAWKDGFLDLSTEFDAAVVGLRQDALSRLAATLDMPKPVAEGTQGESNHWSAWQVEESTYKIYIEPLLDRLGDALTDNWFRPALKSMGIQNPEAYALAWDTTSIVSRPDRMEDLIKLHDLGLVSDDALASEAGIPDGDRPTEDEVRLRRMERVVLGAPSLAADPRFGEALFGFAVAPAAAGVAPGEVGAPALPAGDSSATAGTPDTQGDVPAGLVAASELIVKDALSRAGGRLLTRPYRGQFASTPKHELHTVIPFEDSQRPALMADSFQFVADVADAMAVNEGDLDRSLRGYVNNRLARHLPHDRDLMIVFLGSM